MWIMAMEFQQFMYMLASKESSAIDFWRMEALNNKFQTINPFSVCSLPLPFIHNRSDLVIFIYKIQVLSAIIPQEIPSWSTSTKMTVLKAPLELEHHAISHLKLTLMIYHGVLIEIKKLFWFFHNFTLKLGTFWRFLGKFWINPTPSPPSAKCWLQVKNLAIWVKDL